MAIKVKRNVDICTKYGAKLLCVDIRGMWDGGVESSNPYFSQ